jgi:NADH-quinone oxidoreductase subunit C
MADEENKPQDQTPAPPAGTEKEVGGGPMKTGSSPELEAEAQAAANAAPEGQKEAAAESKVAEKISEARAGVADKGEAGASGDKAKPSVSKSPDDAIADDRPAEKPAPTEKPVAKAPDAEKPAGEKPAPAPKPAAAKPPAAAGDKPAAAKPAAAAGAEGAPKKPAARAPATMPTVEIKDDPLIDSIKEKFGAAILDALSINNQQVIRVTKERAHDLLSYLRNEATPEFNLLTDLTAVHTPDKEKPFTIVYQIYAIKDTRKLRVKAELADGDTIETVTDIWSTANWLEREVFDLFGVRFGNHPDLRRILLPPGWTGHPLRKDYPLEYQDNEWVAQNLKILDLPEDWDFTGKFE